MENRRILERYDLTVPARIEPVDYEEEEVFTLQTMNVCSSGAFFQTEKALPEGTQVKVEMVLPLEKLAMLEDYDQQILVKISGTVLRSGAAGMAVNFNEDYEFGHIERNSFK